VVSSADAAARLAHLEQILAETASPSPAASTTDADAAHVHLNSVPLERIRRLTAELQGDITRTPDEVELVMMRLLLYEYSIAVRHLRAVTRIAAATVDAAADPVRDARRAVHRVSKALVPAGDADTEPASPA
jgi:hypothetical protein